MRYDCGKSGCFNKVHRPKLEMFADCFPGRINFGDVDGLVEINGHFLMLEWKSHHGEIPTGQRITYERLVDTGKFTIVIVCGNAETMEVTHGAVLRQGDTAVEWKEKSLDDIRYFITKWALLSYRSKRCVA